MIGRDRSSLVGRSRGSLVGRSRSSLVGRSGSSLIGRSRSSLVRRSRSSLVRRSSLVSRSSGVGGFTSVADISNVSTVGISHLVCNSLYSAVRKSNSVGSGGGIAVTVLSSIELGSRVVVSNSILVGVHSRHIVGGLFVGRGRGVVGRSRGLVSRLGYNCRGLVGRGRLSHNNRSTVGRLSVHWGLVGRLGSNYGSFIRGSRSMVGRSWSRSMVSRGRGVVCGGRSRSVVSRGRSVISGGRGVVARNSSRSMNSSHLLFTVMVGVNSLRSSMGLAGHRSMGSSVGFVNSYAD